jgi:hypothetical protein
MPNLVNAQLLMELKQQIEKNDASSIELKMRTQVDVDAKTTLEKASVNVEHIHVQVCRFKFVKGLLPKPHSNREHWEGLLKSFGKRMGRCRTRPSPKKQHASTSIESSMLDMPHE